jgi:hypothetical protein
MPKPQKTHPALGGSQHQGTTAISSSKSANINIPSQTQTCLKNTKATAVTQLKFTTAKHAKVSQSLQTPQAPSKGADTAALLEKIALQKGLSIS